MLVTVPTRTCPDGRVVLTVLSLPAAEQDVLVVVGEADLATAGQLREDLLRAVAAAGRPVTVELGALQFCDLCGLRALQDVALAAEDDAVELAFRGMSEQLGWLSRTFPPAGSTMRSPARRRAALARPVGPGEPPRAPAPPDPVAGLTSPAARAVARPADGEPAPALH